MVSTRMTTTVLTVTTVIDNDVTTLAASTIAYVVFNVAVLLRLVRRTTEDPVCSEYEV